MTGTITNREAFLKNISNKLGRPGISVPVERPVWKTQPQKDVLKDANADELVEVLKKQCLNIHTSFVQTDLIDLKAALQSVVSGYGGGPVLAWKDDRFEKWGLGSLFEEEWPAQQIEVNVWDYTRGEKNIQLAEQAKVGLTISEITLAESGTVVIFSDKNKGRSVSFLPETYIALVPKSSLVPRITQAAERMRAAHLEGKPTASCVNFITGPSNSADIELNLVVGVHGPVKATYILINDL